MNLWDLFVNTIAGGFWLSVVLLTIIIFIILALGRLSAFGIFTYLAFFIATMSFAYGYRLLMVFIFGVSLYFAVSQWIGWAERSGGN